MYELLGFAPDVNPMTPGVITNCERVVPFEAGMKGAPSEVDVGITALASSCYGAAVLENLSGNRRFIAGTASKLYENSSTAWTDVSRAGNYTLGADDVWQFAQYGNSALAANLTCKVQRSDSGAFGDITAAPQAKVIMSVKGFVMALNTTDTIYGTSPDRWWCSALFDVADWTPSVATQSATGRLVAASGGIVAGKRFGDDVVAYKKRAVFVGRYAGAPSVWDFQQLSNDIGCVGVNAVADTLIGHIFVGEDNVYVYDGTVPRPLPGSEQIRNWLFRDINPSYNYRTVLVWDRITYTVAIRYVSIESTGAIDSCVVYHVLKQQWGRWNTDMQAAVNYISPSITYNGGSPLITTFDSGPTIPFDSPFWNAGKSVPALFNTSNKVVTLSGATESSSFTTGDYGDEDGYSNCDNLKVRYTQNPTTSSATGYYKDEEGETLTTGDTASKSDGKHDMRQDARFHRFAVAQTGDWKATAIRPKLTPTGTR